MISSYTKMQHVCIFSTTLLFHIILFHICLHPLITLLEHNKPKGAIQLRPNANHYIGTLEPALVLATS